MKNIDKVKITDISLQKSDKNLNKPLSSKKSNSSKTLKKKTRSISDKPDSRLTKLNDNPAGQGSFAPETAEKYHLLYEFAPCGYFTLSTEGRIIELNLSGARILGKKRSSLMGSIFSSFVNPETKPAFNRFIRNVFNAEISETCELTLMLTDNKRIHVYLSGTVIPGEKNSLVTMIDITQRKDLEKSIFSNDQRLRFHLDNSHLAVVEWDADFVVTQWSTEAERMFGWKKEETLNKPIFNLKMIYEEDMPIVDQTMKRLASGKEITVISSNRNYTKSGEIIECIWNNSTLTDENGRMTSVMSLVEDITERKKIEETQLFLLSQYHISSHENFFESLAQFLAKTLEMDYVCIDRLHGDLLSADTVAVYSDGKFEDNVEYTLKDTPCGDVVGKTICCFPEGVRHLFLNDKVLQDMLAESYIGTTLYSYTGQAIGLIAVIGRKPMQKRSLAESILKLVGIRAAGELERITAEEELKYLASYPEQNPSPVIEVDFDGILYFYNPAAKKIFPKISKKGSEQSYFNDWDTIVQALKKKKSRTILFETRIRNRHFLHTLQLIERVERVRIYSTDITKRKHFEQRLERLNNNLEARVKKRTAELLKNNAALQLAEEKFRTVADFTYDWEYWTNPAGSYLYVSPSCERITGYTSQEFLNDKNLIYRIIHPDDLADYSYHVNVEPHGNDNPEIEFRILTKGGDERWIGHVCQHVFGNKGEYLGRRGSNRDITAKVNAEKELLNITIEVEEHERNRFSRELHDGLGPLLSTIKLYFQWLAETDDPEKAKVIIEKGNTNIERAIQTTREVTHGLSPMVLNNFGYVEAMLIFIQNINDTKKITIDFKYNSNKRFDTHLETVLYRTTTELIHNTLNHSGAKHVEIVFKHLKKQNVFTLVYKDDGIGFDAETVKKTSKGLGLINIRQRVNLIKGIIRIESGIGIGMKVYIELPAQVIND